LRELEMSKISTPGMPAAPRRLTEDPKLRMVNVGTEEKAVCTIQLAVNNRTPGGKGKENTLFISADIWGKRGLAARENLNRGKQVLIEGKLMLQKWTGRDGKEQRRYLVAVDEVH
jgi:single-strand DNA-binding protein